MGIVSSAKKILIYGGVFSPPHFGHATCLESALRLFAGDEIWLMPSADDRVDKKISVNAEQRVEMLQLMLAEFFPQTKVPLTISPFEIEHPELDTTYKVKQELERMYPNDEFYFLIGSGLWQEMKEDWQQGEEFGDSAKIIIVERAEVSLPKSLPKNSCLIGEPMVKSNVSSTFIRSLLADGYSGLPYLSPAVANYIKKQQLYTKK
ncbi:MAG: hypothetical protein A2788_01295 [Candidatus Abawacabacteria bacterium RIFCSPHIGHO2_01_FULL_46_8]|uniref:Probable nicotinate-nucleotide adenylyltransferase n=1 Tax=Candidatus Abawacabacteria bacterium RIFCSPHIGHO2_01_FULL_46_8 TaxID=1817815 RepID=A0A1F4XJT3_9BACT|nr:MAG: hypothetical protein A2788_01295 [Candidatus Abawacabacteria bacterium RIFCSPHIGHO2_01_FULL_46_8]